MFRDLLDYHINPLELDDSYTKDWWALDEVLTDYIDNDSSVQFSSVHFLAFLIPSGKYFA